MFVLAAVKVQNWFVLVGFIIVDEAKSVRKDFIFDLLQFLGIEALGEKIVMKTSDAFGRIFQAQSFLTKIAEGLILQLPRRQADLCVLCRLSSNSIVFFRHLSLSGPSFRFKAFRTTCSSLILTFALLHDQRA